MGNFRKSSYTKLERFGGKHRFEHWYRDNSIYFITSKVRDGHRAFATERAKEIFWDRHDHWARHYGFQPWITTLLDNHYHDVGYLEIGENRGPMMQRVHGSVAKLVNDTLEVRWLPFWRTEGNKDYFDGCLRRENQFIPAFNYTKLQAVRAGIVCDYREYPHTRIVIDLEEALRFAIQRDAFLPEVPYARYGERGR